MRKLEIKWDKTKLVSHLGEGFYMKREEEKKKRKKKKERRISGMDCMVLYGYYGFVWICMDFGMDISLFHF